MPAAIIIHCGLCRIEVHGYRSTKGWQVFRVDGEGEAHQADHKLKADAIQAAEDACEPGVFATFIVRPATTKPCPP